MFTQGLVLVVVGMTIVGLFLGMLVLAVKLSTLIIPRLNHLLPDDEPRTQAPAAATPVDAEAATVAIVVALAAKASQRDRRPKKKTTF